MTDSQTETKTSWLSVDFEALLAAVVQRLVKLDQLDAALALAEARIVRVLTWKDRQEVEVHLDVPGDHYDALTRAELLVDDTAEGEYGEYTVPNSSILVRAFTAALPPRVECRGVEIKIRNDPVSETWRDDFKASIGRGAVNQGNVPGVPPAPFVTRDGLRYRSKTEMKVEGELRRRSILFFPLPAAVIGGKAVREPDFVILYEGRAAILEIHGEPWHPPSRAAQDHAKSMPYRLQGAEHLIVDAKEAYNAPGVVVDRLLALMKRKA